MKILLDTVAVYRAATQPEALPEAARSLLEDESHTVLVSLVSAWELPSHHADPFDRLIIAQALADECTVITSDARFAAYGVRVVW